MRSNYALERSVRAWQGCVAGLIEPVFGNIRHTKRLSRFTPRGRRKVNAQWQMYCLVHNIEKLQRYGRLDERERLGRRRVA